MLNTLLRTVSYDINDIFFFVVAHIHRNIYTNMHTYRLMKRRMPI